MSTAIARATLLAALAAAGGCGTPAPPPDARAEAPILTEIAGEVGLDFEHFIGSTGEFYFPEMAGPGVALFDYDGDGDLDLYVLQGEMLDPAAPPEAARFPPPARHWPGNRLFRNELVPEGRLRFTDVTDAAGVGHRGYGYGAAVGDYDNDGDPDLFITNFGANVLYRNDGDGTFTDVTAGAGVGDERWGTSAAFFDYDRDGDLDLFVVNYVTFSVTANKPCSTPAGQRDYCGPLSFDPVPDILYRNEGGGRFTDVSAQAGLGAAFGSGLGVTCADFDGDGWTDVYVANDGRANQLWRNRGDGTFEDVALMAGTAYNGEGKAEAGMGVTAGDFDNDGDDDLFMTHLDGETNTLYVNDGRGRFQDATSRLGLAHLSLPYTGFGTAWFDYDHDGWLDLFIANGAVNVEEQLQGTPYPYQQPNQLLHNERGQGFRDVSAAARPALELFEVSRAAAFGDVDNDGDLDIVMTNNNGPLRLFRNETGDRRPWLRLRLTGTRSPRDGTGARAGVILAGGAVIWRRAHTDGSYLAASDPRVHFGLGEERRVEGIVVAWPSGLIERFPATGVDRELALTEGGGAPWTP